MSPGGQTGNGVSAQLESADTPSPFALPGVESGALATLEFFQALEVVASHASGPLGALRVQARRPSTDRDWIESELVPVREALELLRAADGLEVVPTPDLRPALARLVIDGSVLDGHELLLLQGGLAASRQVRQELRRVAPRAPRIALLEVPVPDRRLEQRLVQSLDQDGELLDAASPALAQARRDVQVARDRVVRKLEGMLHHLDAQAAPAGATVTVRNGRYVIPVRRDSRSRPQGIVHDESGTAGTLFIEPTDAIEFGNALREAIVAESRETLRVLRELTELLRPEAAALAAGQEMCAAADDVAARARYAHAVLAEVPVVAPPGGALRVRRGRHPLLLARGVETVPFDLDMEAGERTLLISGPNAGGKTVLLKAVGVSASLVQSGIVPPVGAESRFPVFTGIFADIGDHQSINADLSTFSAHAAMLRAVLADADRESLVLLDEVGSGTDPAEGAALAWAALESLTGRGALTLATTHLGTLKTLASHLPGVVNGSLEFDAARLSPTYRFQKGVPGRSYGLAIARRLGVDPEVLARAEAQVPEGERALDRLLHEVESRDQALRLREAELAREQAEADRLRTELAERLDAAAERERELRRREREAEQRARSQAREFLLGARKTVEEAIQVATQARTEEAARGARRDLERAIQESRSVDGEMVAPGTLAAVAPGRRVRLAAGGLGRVEEVRDDGRLVVIAGSIRMVVPADAVAEVLPAEPAQPRAALDRHPEPAGTAEAALDVDLRGLRVDEAEMAMLSALDAAILADQPFLRVIHGKGTGAVRDRVHAVLRGDRRVARYLLAPANQGGSGVTIVEFRP